VPQHSDLKLGELVAESHFLDQQIFRQLASPLVAASLVGRDNVPMGMPLAEQHTVLGRTQA
jgi:hypothetical protein